MAGDLEHRYYAEAERLYVREGLGLQKVADALGPEGPSATTVHKWSQKGDWKGQKERWKQVTSDMPTRMLEICQRRIDHLHQHIDKAKADELLKLNNILQYLTTTLAGGDEGGGPQVDKLAVWLEVLNDLVTDLREIEPEAVGLLDRNFSELTKRARVRYA